MVFREKSYYKPIKNGPGLNPGEYLYLYRLYYYYIENKNIETYNKGP